MQLMAYPLLKYLCVTSIKTQCCSLQLLKEPAYGESTTGCLFVTRTRRVFVVIPDLFDGNSHKFVGQQQRFNTVHESYHARGVAIVHRTLAKWWR